MSDSLRFSVTEIREAGGLCASLEVEPALIFPEPVPNAALAGPVAAELEFSVGGNRILLQLRISGSWKTNCSRCLAEHRVDFAASAEETYPLDQDSVDVGEEVRQAALLEVPQRSLCRADCKGLCPQCGKDLNAEPCGCVVKPPSPFAALKKLKGS
ncbi:MAG: hypothetical protein A2X36_15215 [Elusimicrobia bacterium GWA2_69_24]|nr:MAG: hypothetical protein A2X36_15215 [Elusimicrobia bacterium GWA2_69_24]HBL16834.1 hypothetical protein [Elusimicrobiota bacterium]